MKLPSVLNHLGVLGAATILLTGCDTLVEHSLTYKLWDSEDFHNSASPAGSARISLYHLPPNRVVVAYEELSEKRGTVQRRAYILSDNRDRIERGEKPKFKKLKNVEKLVPLPLSADPIACANRAATGEASFTLLKEGSGFTLCGTTDADGVYHLPVYTESSGTLLKVALTPVVFAADTAFYGTVGGFFLWLFLGAPH